ncbi:MAG: hypothetical protein AAF846_00825 [Chloroflexota bacterium]
MKKQFPEAHPFFDRTMAILSVLAIFGLFIDGWAHNHGAVDETFFTPWHAVLYGAYGLLALTLAGTHFYYTSKGYAFSHALPQGYRLSLIGAGIFILGGVGDAIWHELFGFEENIEILISPTHIVLFAAYIMILFGNIYARWSRPQVLRGWSQLWDVAFLWLAVFSVMTFVTQYAHYLHALEYLTGDFINPRNIWIYNEFGATSFLLTSIIVTSVWLIMARRWQLPFGILTFLIGSNTFLMAGMVINDYGDFNSEWAGIVTLMAVGAVGTLIADAVVYYLKPSPHRLKHMYLSAFLMPTIVTLGFILSVNTFGQLAFGDDLWWSTHLIIGLPVSAGSLGLFLALMMYPPAVPQEY